MRDLIFVGWMAVCGLGVKWLGLPIAAAVSAFFIGIVVYALQPWRYIKRSATRRPIAAGPPPRSNLAFAGVVVVVGVVLFASTMLLTQPKTPQAQTVSFTPSIRCENAKVHDGDTLRCADGMRIRLHAVAAREVDGSCTPGHPCPTASAQAATGQLRLLAQGQTLSCERIGRSYDRVTAICRNQIGVEINCAMIRSGTALIWPKFNRQAPICR